MDDNCSETDVADLLEVDPDHHDVAGPTATPFCVDNAERANWVVRRILEARAYRDRVHAWAEREVRRAEHDEERLMYLFGRQLQDWVGRELATPGQRRRSIRLPGGTVGFRRVGPKLLVEDPAAVLAWARENLPPAVVTKEHLGRTALNEHVKQTGELPTEGVRVEPAHDAFYIS